MALLGGERLPPWPLDLVSYHFLLDLFFFGLSWFIVFGFFSFLDLNVVPFLTWFYCLLFISVHQARSSCFYIDREHKPLLMKVNREFVKTTNCNLCPHQEFGDRGWTTLFLEDFQLYGLVSERGCWCFVYSDLFKDITTRWGRMLMIYFFKMSSSFVYVEVIVFEEVVSHVDIGIAISIKIWKWYY